MGRLSREINIGVPAKQIYAYVSNPRNAPAFISSISRIVSGPEGAQEGGLWRAEANFLGRRSTVALRLARLEPDSVVAFNIEGEPRAVLAIVLVPSRDGASTRVSLTLDVPSVPDIFLGGLMGSLLSGDMTRLKRLLEVEG